jgi:hypothetical protein
MKAHTSEEIKAFFTKLFDWEAPSVSVLTNANDLVSVEVEQMYSYVSFNLKMLLEIAEFFGTQNINDNKWSSGGCETCDYGSSYRVEFYNRPEK